MAVIKGSFNGYAEKKPPSSNVNYGTSTGVVNKNPPKSSSSGNYGTFNGYATPSPKPPVSSGGSSSNKNYSSNSSQAANDIIYWKQQYDKAVSEGKGKDSLSWIQNQAGNVYNQMDKGLADKLRGMNASEALNQYNSGKLFGSTSGGSPTTIPSGNNSVVKPNIPPVSTKNYASDSKSAANDIIYWKQQYDKAVSSGNKDSLDWIKKQANNVYGQIGDKALADKLRGMNATDAKAAYDNGSLFGQVPPNPMNPNEVPTDVPMENQGPSPEEMLQQMYMQLMQQMMEQMQGGNQDQMMQIEEQAQKQYQMLVDQLNQNLNYFNTSKDNQLNNLDNLYAQGKADLQDTSFQDYLAARQSMANRGLAGSGLASDQDTRLLMANDRNLQKLQDQINNQKFNTINDFNNQANQIQNQLKNTSYSDFYNNMMQQFQANNGKNMGAFGDLMKTLLPYMGMTQKDRAENDLAYAQMDSSERQFYSKLAQDEKLTYAKLGSEERQLYAKLSSDEKIEFAKMDNSNKQLAAKLNQEYGLKMTELMGRDQNGNPTLDAQKVAQQAAQAQARLYEQNRHNRASEAVSWARVNQSANEFELKIAKFNADAIKYQNKIDTDASNTAYKQQADGLSKMLNSAQKDMTSLRGSLGKYTTIPKQGTPEYAAYESLNNKYNEATLNYNAAYNGLKKLSGNGDYGTDPTRTPMGTGNLR